MVRRAEIRKKKYAAGIDSKKIARNLEALKPVMVDQQKVYFSQIVNVEQKAKQICEAAGVASYQIAQYVNVARQCYSLAKRFDGATQTLEAQAVVDHWAARGLNGPLLAEVCRAGGCKPEAPPVPPTVLNLDDLEDVEITSPETCQVLHYDDATKKWGNYSMVVGGVFYPPGLRNGRYYSCNLVTYQHRYTSYDVTYNQLRATPIIIPERKKLTRLVVYVAGGPALGLIRIGIYDDEGLYPDNLVVDAGEFSTAVAGYKEATIDVTVDPGLYWMVQIVNTDSINLWYQKDYYLNLLGTVSLGWGWDIAWRKTHPYGALPDPFPAGGTSHNYAYWMMVKVAAP